MRPRPAFGQEGEEQQQQGHQFDSGLFTDVLTTFLGPGGLIPTIIVVANDAENRESMAKLIEASGGNPAESQETIDEYARITAALAAERDAALAAGDQARADAINADIANAQNNTMRTIVTEQEGGISPWAVAGVAMGSVVALAVTVLVITTLVRKKGSSNIYLPGYNPIY